MELCFSELKTHVLSTALFIIEVDLQDDVINTFFQSQTKCFFFLQNGYLQRFKISSHERNTPGQQFSHIIFYRQVLS